MTLPGDCFDIHVQLHDLQTCSLFFSAWFLGSLITRLAFEKKHGKPPLCLCKMSGVEFAKSHEVVGIFCPKKATIALLAVQYHFDGEA